MKVNGRDYRTIWLDPDDDSRLQIIDQRLLPHKFEVITLKTADDVFHAIADMAVRGAPLIGAAAAYGMYLAALDLASAKDFNEQLAIIGARLASSRPTAINLSWAIERQLQEQQKVHSVAAKIQVLKEGAEAIADSESSIGNQIGLFGLELIREIAKRKSSGAVNILTHCNAGWLCSVDWGTATAPMYHAFNHGISLHIWVDETRPRNQGAALTAWELGEHGVPYTVITDNAGGHLMQQGLVDLVIVGTDRLTVNGDAANKIGTYLKALAAHDNGVPFYVAAPSSSIDWQLSNMLDVPIEQRHADEVKYVTGRDDSGAIKRVLITPETASVANYGFDVTPARLISGIITERGIVLAKEEALRRLFPERQLPV